MTSPSFSPLPVLATLGALSCQPASASQRADAAVASHADAGSSSPSPSGRAPGDRESPPQPPDGMLPVPGGTFTMGADAGGQPDERPAHPVTLGPFFLDRTEVTNAAYQSCVGAGACKPNATSIASLTHAGDDARFHRPAQPVNGVTWFDARDYCAWRGARLPTEAEFERTIRGDDGRRFPWAPIRPRTTRTVFGEPLLTGTTEDVGSHPSGRGPYGHDDLAGNVWEWMADEYDPYALRACHGARRKARALRRHPPCPGRAPPGRASRGLQEPIRSPPFASASSAVARSTTTPTGYEARTGSTIRRRSGW